MRELERDLPTTARRAPAPAPLPALAIVGAGRVGSSIAAAARRPESTSRSAVAPTPPTPPAAEVVLLCVPDEAIAEAARGPQPAPRLRFAGHTSGATGLEALAPAGRAPAPRPSRSTRCRRCRTADRLHRRALRDLGLRQRGAGASRARLPRARHAAVRDRRGRPGRLPRGGRDRLELSRRAPGVRRRPARPHRRRGRPRAAWRRSSCGPPRTGPSAAREALTGPIARGDETVERHREELVAGSGAARPLRRARGARPGDRARPRREAAR